MAYVKLNLPDGTVINEEHLKHIEEGIANAISNSQQTLTEEQKAQARENIGAAAEGSGGSSVQSDWNQNDETQPDFIKNKPFYDTKIVILEEQELPYNAEFGGCMGTLTTPIEIGDTLLVVFDGKSYECNAVFMDATAVAFGNFALMGAASSTSEPFLGVYAKDEGVVAFITADEANHTVKISIVTYVKIPEQFYNRDTLLYVNVSSNDPYIYTDADLNNKATKEDVRIAFNKGSVRIGMSMFGIAVEFLMAIATHLTSGEEYATLYAIDQTSSSYKLRKYYTAEYTPTT